MINNYWATKIIVIFLGAIIVAGVASGLLYFIGEEHRVAIVIFLIVLTILLVAFDYTLQYVEGGKRKNEH